MKILKAIERTEADASISNIVSQLDKYQQLKRVAGKIGYYQKLKRYAVHRLTLVPRDLSELTPANYNMPFEEIVFQSRDGINLHGWCIPTQNSRATIIIAHGYTRSKTSYLQIAEWLWKAGYSVFMFDFRGHGQSEGSSGTSVGFMERLDIHGAIDYLQTRYNQPIGVLGVSMGASAAILAASENPNIRAVVADSPYAHLYRSIATQISETFPAPRWLAVRLAKFAFRAMAEHHGFEMELAHPANYIHLIAPRPLFLMHGEADSLTELENSLMLYILAREPKQIWTVPDLEHVQLYKVCPQEYQERLLDFLDRVNWDAPMAVCNSVNAEYVYQK